MNKHVFGVVVTYHPDKKNILNLIKTATQVHKLVVVDNGSGVEIENELENLASKSPNIEIIKNQQNLGIDKATNIGIKKYIDEYKYVLTLDQDSQLGENMVYFLEKGFDEVADNTCVMIGPNIINNGVEEQSLTGEYQKADLLIASGCLIKTDYLKMHGLLDEYFFIDCNDTDLSLRIRSQGQSIYKAKKAILYHSMGYGTVHIFFGNEVVSENYSPFRRYFQSRNSTEILYRYFFKFPKLTVKFWVGKHIKDNIKILLFEENKVEKLKYGFLGSFDWFFRRGYKRF